jgi:Rrf2 family transcriptional regulator, cysteine metabolism repressor
LLEADLNFTAKEDYGIRAVLDIALNRAKVPIQTKDIATRQDIPEQFLEQVLATLRRAEVVRSIRGASGGYDLAKPADRIAVGDILKALSGPILPLPFVGSDAPEGEASSTVSHFWLQLRESIEKVVGETTIQDLADYHLQSRESQSFMMNI